MVMRRGLFCDRTASLLMEWDWGRQEGALCQLLVLEYAGKNVRGDLDLVGADLDCSEKRK